MAPPSSKVALASNLAEAVELIDRNAPRPVYLEGIVMGRFGKVDIDLEIGRGAERREEAIGIRLREERKADMALYVYVL